MYMLNKKKRQERQFSRLNPGKNLSRLRSSSPKMFLNNKTRMQIKVG